MEYTCVLFLSALYPPHPPLLPPQPLIPPMCTADIDIHVLNNRAELDFFTSYNLIYRDHIIDDDPYFGMSLHSQYHDIESLSGLCEVKNRPVILSINIQSLQSKSERLCLEINDILAKDIEIVAIVLQETWNIPYPEKFGKH